MALSKSIGRRRAEIRKNRPDLDQTLLGRLLRPEFHVPLLVAFAFVVCASAILMLRTDVVSWRVGQYAPHDIVARVEFVYRDPTVFDIQRRSAREQEPRVYRAAEDPFVKLQQELIALPALVQRQKFEQLSEPYSKVLDPPSMAMLQDYADSNKRAIWTDLVQTYTGSLQKLGLAILPDADRNEDLTNKQALVRLGALPTRIQETVTPSMRDDLETKFAKPAKDIFPIVLAPKIVDLTLDRLTPNYTLDALATVQAQNAAAERVSPTIADIQVKANQTYVSKGQVDLSDFNQLKAEHEAYLASLGSLVWMQRLGMVAAVIVLTAIGGAYVAKYQPRIVRNHARAVGLAALMLSMLLLSQLAALGSARSYMVYIAPTLTVAMILAIAYDQRFAIGMGAIHALLATLAVNEGLDFLLILMTGVATCCFLLDDVRTRSRLIEVGGACAMALIGVTVAAGLLDMDPVPYIIRNAIYSGAAGLAVGFITLGILPFIERVFKITTSMTLLELADASLPLLRRLALEAPGTYNHSLQVATLAEEGAEAIGANSLLCRVASYYHDVGKINKAEYFVENQQPGQNRHMNLSPSVSLLIIIGHVKDGIELAKEYALPTSIIPFIQQHHGTTLVEFFYHRARTGQDMNDPLVQEVNEHQYRYPGPKPRTRETAIVMLADACESATRAMDEPNSNRIETLVHEMAMKRLLDGQFDESELTMRELELIERSLVKSLLGLYHGRIQYPADIRGPLTQSQPFPTPQQSAKTA